MSDLTRPERAIIGANARHRTREHHNGTQPIDPGPAQGVSIQEKKCVFECGHTGPDMLKEMLGNFLTKNGLSPLHVS
jgi:hypothetical protein